VSWGSDEMCQWFCWCHVTSSGRSFHVCGGDQKSSTTNSRQSAGRHYQAILVTHQNNTELASLPVTDVQYCIDALSHRQQIRSISTDDNYLKPATSSSAWTSFRIHLRASPDTCQLRLPTPEGGKISYPKSLSTSPFHRNSIETRRKMQRARLLDPYL